MVSSQSLPANVIVFAVAIGVIYYTYSKVVSFPSLEQLRPVTDRVRTIEEIRYSKGKNSYYYTLNIVLDGVSAYFVINNDDAIGESNRQKVRQSLKAGDLVTILAFNETAESDAEKYNINKVSGGMYTDKGLSQFSEPMTTAEIKEVPKLEVVQIMRGDQVLLDYKTTKDLYIKNKQFTILFTVIVVVILGMKIFTRLV